jgi:hypothetical protein
MLCNGNHPKFVFRITHILSADGTTAGISMAQTSPNLRRIAPIHPRYAYGHIAAKHFTLAIERSLLWDRGGVGELAGARHHRLYDPYHRDHFVGPRPVCVLNLGYVGELKPQTRRWPGNYPASTQAGADDVF